MADPDDLDDLLRTAMKSLDAQLPSGYFEALPNRTLARLSAGETDMQQGSTSGNRPAPSVPGAPVPLEEDSGLHDIRNLAQTAKQRISSKRESTHPPVSDDELLASSSASWKNLALPKPANMVSLPELDQLPSKAEIKAEHKAMAQAARAAAVEPAPALEARPSFAPQIAQRGKSNKTRNLAIAGIGLAAAAGVVLFVTMQKQNAATPTPTQASERTVATAQPIAAAAAPTVQHIEEPARADTGAAGSGVTANSEAASGAAEAPPAAVDMPSPPPPAKVAVKHMGKAAPARTKASAATIAKPDTQTAPAAPKVEATKDKKGDPSFDALLKEAGVNEKKDTKPVLDRKELSGADFKNGMAAISAKAQACFKGTQGTATVKLVIAPSGHVSRVTVSGMFAGKPEADCVSAAVKSATFPAWDGGSQSMGYSYLLSE
jgi:hypothetical protein